MEKPILNSGGQAQHIPMPAGKPPEVLQVMALLATCCVCASLAAEPKTSLTSVSPHRLFSVEGWPTDQSFFPIAVWLQSPGNAQAYKAAGFNLYVGLWRGPTIEQLAQLEKAGMALVCEQNRMALENKNNSIIAGWMHGDEPDNAQALPNGKGYGPPVPPENIVRDYQRLHAADPSRPVLLNLGQGVAWDDWYGRGVRSRHPEDYAEYVKGCDVASFDIYPVVHDSPQVAGKLEFVARGVERLEAWTHGKKPIWSCIECTHIGNPNVKPTPQQVHAEVWMALIRGARGLIYFVHQFKPSFREAALLDDPDMLAGVTDLNRQIHRLAPLLNSATVDNKMTVRLANSAGTIATMVKESGDELYIFAVNLVNRPIQPSFTLHEPNPPSEAEVLDESRRVSIKAKEFADEFNPYGVHLYHIGKNARPGL